jgi:hypothetical protein
MTSTGNLIEGDGIVSIARRLASCPMQGYRAQQILWTNAEEKNNQGLLHGLSQVKDDSKILDFPKPDDS